MAVILCYTTEFGYNYVKMVDVRPILPATRTELKESSVRQYMIYGDILGDY